MMMKAVKERLRWFQAFMPLYEKAEPLVRYITNLEKLQAGELPVSPGMLVESNLTLRPILAAISKMHKPKEKELAIIQREFEMALSNCIKASEWAEKYINYGGHGMDGQMLLSMVINATVLAHEYIESVSKKLATFHEVDSTS
jgi:hypothetical protein